MLDSPIILVMGIAFLSAFTIQRLGLPALVGFLIAGFAFNAIGMSEPLFLYSASELGVLLLLFTIGLKIDFRVLLRKEILLGTPIHTLLASLSTVIILVLLSFCNFPSVTELASKQLWIIGFALSFSSTVLAVKFLQEHGGLTSISGRIALGILVLQDLIAVLFLTVSSSAKPSPWALGLLVLPFLRPVFYWVLDRLGHNELLILAGVTIALLPGAALFHHLGVDPELGALLMGMLLTGHPRAPELSNVLFSLKEFFLIAFFVEIGFSDTFSWKACSMALLLLLALPIKGIIYYGLMRFFRFRVRTAVRVSVILCNFSEFGLIVMNIATKQGILPAYWVGVVAVTTAFSFLLSGLFHRVTDPIHAWLLRHGARDENPLLHKDDQFINPGHVKVLILGMGRVGTGAYQELARRYGEVILGVELSQERVLAHQKAQRNVIAHDAADPDFWQRILPGHDIALIVLAMPHWESNQEALKKIQKSSYRGKIAGIAEYETECMTLQNLGADAVFNLYREAGSGFARHLISTLQTDRFLPRLEETSQTEHKAVDGRGVDLDNASRG